MVMRIPEVSEGLSNCAIAELVGDEWDWAATKFPPFASAHEGYSIILEEVDELWEEVRKGNKAKARAEAVQVAAMALRFIHDVIG
jgi:hypothetical protein